MTSTKTEPIQINSKRLRDDITALSHIGRSKDMGIYRMAFTRADMEARAWLKSRIQDAGLEVDTDGAANVFGRLKSQNDLDKPRILLGSHIDTVPGAGHLDGTLGVLVALECLRRFQEEKIQTNYPIEMVAFTDEEGRFGGLFGSQALCGEVTPDSIYKAVDLNGKQLVDVMKEHGLDAMDALQAHRSPNSLHAYLELHIEQGPVLDRQGIPIGIVHDITGLFKWSIRLIGAADHAGTTPMNMRRDALQGLAEFAGEINRILEEHGSETSVATIGKIELFPGTANTVPGTVKFSLDVRDISVGVLVELAEGFRRALSAIARRRNLMFEFDILSQVDPEQCDPGIVKILSKQAETLNYEYLVMPSGAAHDAQIMSKITNVGLMFVPSKDGRSHSPAEWTHWEDIEKGANVYINTVLQIAEAQ